MKSVNKREFFALFMIFGSLMQGNGARAACDCPNGDHFDAGKRALYKDPLPDGFVAEPIHIIRVDSCEVAYFNFYTTFTFPNMKPTESREYSMWATHKICKSLAQNQKSIDREQDEIREAKNRERLARPDATDAAANVDLDKVSKEQREKARKDRFDALLSGLSDDKFKEPTGSAGHQIHENIPAEKFTNITLHDGVTGKSLPLDPSTYTYGHYIPDGTVADSEDPNEVLDENTKGVRTVKIPKGRSGVIVGYGQNPGTWVVKFESYEARETGRYIGARLLGGSYVPPRPQVTRVAFAEVEEEQFNKEIMYHSQIHGSLPAMGQTLHITDSDGVKRTIETPADTEFVDEAP